MSTQQSLNQPDTIIEPPELFRWPDLQALWRYRELAFLFTWRDIKARYKQTILGAGWALLDPITNMIIFTFIFRQIGNVDSLGYPYPIFNFAALLPWILLSNTLSGVAGIITGNSSIIKKIYFPRLILPLSTVLSKLVDILPSFFLLILMMIYFQVPITLNIIFLPIFLVFGLMIMVGFGLWLASLNVFFRDVRYAAPFLIRILMWVSPIGYAIVELPERWRVLYSLNPFVGIFEGSRWALLGTTSFEPYMLISTILFAIVAFISGIVFFNRSEKFFADVV